ncbi:dihydropteroate synthase [Nocardioides sp. GXQ0305]|uniref:dihydropteroate synthase n=1 Tax=Nocardioides sp. GXQ0305 TaxID=3423912 RepID=UPI003D7C7DA6
MISLAALAELHDRHRADLDLPVTPVPIADGVVVRDGSVTVMGVVNLSRDSTYRESVAVSTESAVRMARVQAAQGATIVDIGAEASGQQADRTSPGEQLGLLLPVVDTLARELVLSVETYQPEVVDSVLRAGARVLNLTGREDEDEMLRLVAAHDATVLMCFGETANVREDGELPVDGDPMPVLADHFAPRIERARELGVERIVVDPAVGFHYGNLTEPLDRVRHQARILSQSFRLRSLGVPVAVSVPHSFDLFEDEFRRAEGFFTVLAALGGTQLVRIHEVPHVVRTLRALDVLEIS